MECEYHLKQKVIVIKKSLLANTDFNDKRTTASFDDTFYLGEVAAIKDEHQVCIHRLHFNALTNMEITELQWINLLTEDYEVIPATVFYKPQNTTEVLSHA